MPKHVDHLLTAYIHGELDAAARTKVEEHLSECRACCEEHRRMRNLISSLGCLKLEPAPEQWKRICDGSVQKKHPIPTWKLGFAGVATAALLAVAMVLTRPSSPPAVTATGPGFEILNVSGAVRVADGKAMVGGLVRQGETLVTSRGAEAKIEVADIGEVTVGEDSEVQLVSSSSKQHRMRLSKGRLSAKVTAPPRLFVIETPAADAVDLGCAYTLEVDEAGDTVLHVQTGWVAMERNGPDSIVPAGWTCVTRKDAGVGTPVCGTAKEDFRKDLEEWDVSKSPSAVSRALKQARKIDALSLWHLLSRTDAELRKEVFAALRKQAPLPANVTAEAVLALDPKALEAWRDAIMWPPGSRPELPFGLSIPSFR